MAAAVMAAVAVVGVVAVAGAAGVAGVVAAAAIDETAGERGGPARAVEGLGPARAGVVLARLSASSPRGMLARVVGAATENRVWAEGVRAG